MRRTYLAGKMTGVQAFNFPAFDAAAAELRERGYEVFNPAENDRAKHPEIDWSAMTGSPEETKALGFNLREALRDDLCWIAEHADTIHVLPNWRSSKGAIAEVALAFALGIPVIEYIFDELVDAQVVAV